VYQLIKELQKMEPESEVVVMQTKRKISHDKISVTQKYVTLKKHMISLMSVIKGKCKIGIGEDFEDVKHGVRRFYR